MTTQTPATAEIEKWLRIRVRFFTKFWLRIRAERKTQNPSGVDSSSPDPLPSLQRWADCEIFNPSPILICKSWIRSSPALQNFWKSSVQSSRDPPIQNHTFYFASWGEADTISWNKIDTIFWHSQNLIRQCIFCHQREKHWWSYLPLGAPNW